MKIENQKAIVTGASGGIGLAVARRLAEDGATVAMVDLSNEVHDCAAVLNGEVGAEITRAFCGDVCDASFRREVFVAMEHDDEPVRICVPAAGILRDALAVKMNRETGKAELYDDETFRKVIEINLLHPLYWSMEMLARIAEKRRGKKWQAAEQIQGVAVLIGSVSSRGNRGQIAYASTKSALTAAAKTLNIEGAINGVQTKIIHPGMVNTPMLEQLPEGVFSEQFQPKIPLGRMIEPKEIAEAVGILIKNPAISGPLWADAGLPPMA